MWKADSEMVQNIQRWEYEGGRIVRRPENSPQIKKQHDADSPQREPVKRGETNRIMQLATRPHPMEAHRANRPSGPAPGEAALQGQRRAHDFIVVAMDFSEAANRALEIALRHAKWLNSPVLLVHVIENGYAEGFLENHRKEHLRAKTYATAEKKLKDLVATRRRRGVPIFFEIRSGLPDYELLEAAQSAQAKMIVLGRPRRSALARVLLGSVSENVVDASPIPILIVPASL